MNTVDIPLDKAELLSVLLEALLYGKAHFGESSAEVIIVCG